LKKQKSTLNKTILLLPGEKKLYTQRLIKLENKSSISDISNKTINQDFYKAADFLPSNFVDLLIIDPPYNIYKNFNSNVYKSKGVDEYASWFDEIIIKLKPILKAEASIYVCSDWFTSISIATVLQKHFKIRNRITWEREKGRGAKSNWKNSSEDIWFCTVSNKYHFNSEKVKLLKKVIAPYRDENGIPKDWKFENGTNYRLTFPSNLWNDISVPFWSMPENTEHPTQKPEKLIAKLIIASSKKGDYVFDPFAGSGTTLVTAKKLGRNYTGIELDKEYACITEKRLNNCKFGDEIQGYEHGFFWERNTHPFRIKPGNSAK
jgi:site-specific DNA-methyltransferase (adenine-specific)